MRFIYPAIEWIYLLIPVAASGWVLLTLRQKRFRPLRAFLRVIIAGVLMGLALVQGYAALAGARVPLGQTARACYLVIAALCVVVALNGLFSRAVIWLFHTKAAASRRGGRILAQISAGVLQAALLLVIGLPFLGSLLLVYRPKAPSTGDPLSLIDAAFEPVQFRATDGVRVSAWWIPAVHNARTDGRGRPKHGRDTVLFCHGFGADKGAQLFLVRDLVANGYNVLAIDLRAHGRSGGQFTGFGAVEGRDVLGAVRWLKMHRPANCRRILGLGESLGAVALVEAAADAGPDGQAIDAIAAYNPYDDLRQVVQMASESQTIGLGQWALRDVVLPFASIQVGADLTHFVPVSAARQLWPRPILVIGNPKLRLPAACRSYEFFWDTLQPKYSYFREDANRDELLHDKKAALTVRIFFDEEQSIL